MICTSVTIFSLICSCVPLTTFRVFRKGFVLFPQILKLSATTCELFWVFCFFNYLIIVSLLLLKIYNICTRFTGKALYTDKDIFDYILYYIKQGIKNFFSIFLKNIVVKKVIEFITYFFPSMRKNFSNFKVNEENKIVDTGLKIAFYLTIIFYIVMECYFIYYFLFFTENIIFNSKFKCNVLTQITTPIIFSLVTLFFLYTVNSCYSGLDDNNIEGEKPNYVVELITSVAPLALICIIL